MTKIPEHGSDEAARVAVLLGWKLVPKRGKGSHSLYKKEGYPRPLIIPHRDFLKPGLIKSLIRTMGITKEKYISLLSPSLQRQMKNREKRSRRKIRDQK
jgi:predicted RNA binding protein YcfA (HicA-like mRNA interferase family)